MSSPAPAAQCRAMPRNAAIRQWNIPTARSRTMPAPLEPLKPKFTTGSIVIAYLLNEKKRGWNLRLAGPLAGSSPPRYPPRRRPIRLPL